MRQSEKKGKVKSERKIERERKRDLIISTGLQINYYLMEGHNQTYMTLIGRKIQKEKIRQRETHRETEGERDADRQRKIQKGKMRQRETVKERERVERQQERHIH